MKQIFPILSAVFGGLTVVLASLWLAPMALPVVAADLDRGVRAYDAGVFAAAAEEWRQLAEAGDMVAQFNLALLHDNPESGMFDGAAAVAWYKRAAAQGSGAAQFNLAVAYQMGRGVPKDSLETLFWLLVAMRADDAAISGRALGAAATLSAILTEDVKSRARRRADQWQAVAEEVVGSEAGADVRPYMTLSEADIMTIQRRLKSLGYDPGVIDGVAGAQTQRALAGYFEDRSIEWLHGPLSHDLLERLD